MAAGPPVELPASVIRKSQVGVTAMPEEEEGSQKSLENPIVAPSYGRRRSSVKMPGIIKRAASSPNVRSLASSDNMSLSAADKKRNKLGYHRTAVACGHCRRRKIRCIPAFEDTSGRCQNCIRLKKECHFFPVDQQSPAVGKRNRSTSKAEGLGNDAETSVSSSSPGILGSSSMDQIDQVNGQLGTPPLPQDSPGYPSMPGVVGNMPPHGYSHLREYDYQHGYEHPSHSLGHYPGQSPQIYQGERVTAETTPSSSSYYQTPDHQILQGPFTTSPYTSTPLSQTMSASPQGNTYHFQQSRHHGDYQWQPHGPVRSMSIPETEDFPQHFGLTYRTNTYPSFDRRMSMASDGSHLPSTNPNLMTGSHDNQSLPITSGIHEEHRYHPHMQAHMQPDWSAATGHGQTSHLSGPGTEGYARGWYPAGSNLGGSRPEEERPRVLASQSHDPHNFPPNPG